jgi:hypothetical protein
MIDCNFDIVVRDCGAWFVTIWIGDRVVLFRRRDQEVREWSGRRDNISALIANSTLCV